MSSQQSKGTFSLPPTALLSPRHGTNCSALTVSKTYDKFLEKALETKEWRCNIKFKAVIPRELMFVYNLPPVDGYAAVLPLCEFIGRTPFSFNAQSSYQFDPSEFNSDDAQGIQKIKNHIIEECRLSGFVIQGRTRSRPDRIHRKTTIEFKCDHNKSVLVPKFDETEYERLPGTKVPTAKQKKSVPSKDAGSLLTVGAPALKRGQNIHVRRRTNSKRPIREEDRCPFQFAIFFDGELKRWFLRTETPYERDSSCLRDYCLHKGHYKIAKECIPSPHSSLSDAEIKLALQCDLVGITPEKTATILEGIRGDGSCLSVKQMEYIKSKAKAQEELNKFKEGSSSAERLIASFDQLKLDGHGVNYTALIHHYDHGFRIKNSRGRPRKDIDGLGKHILLQSDLRICQLSENLTFSSLKDDLNIEEIRESQSIGIAQEVLLAFAWVTDEELSLVQRFPEFLSADVTERTNIEKRGLFLMTGLDGNNSTFIGMHAFIPNAQMDSFDWIYTSAIPDLISEKTCLENECVVTDGEDALFMPLCSQTNVPGPWRNSSHRRCTYHLFTQQWAKHIAGNANGVQAKKRVKTIRDWVNSLIVSVRLYHDFLDSVEKLKKYLDDAKEFLTSHLFRKLYNLIFTGMVPICDKWARCCRFGKLDLNQCSTSHTERCNRGIKDQVKSISVMGIDTSATAIMEHSSGLNQKRQRKNAIQLNSITTWTAGGTKEILTNYAEGIASNLKSNWKNYKVCRVDKHHFLVCHKTSFEFEVDNRQDKRRLIPRYSVCHEITLDELRKGACCSCNERGKTGFPCVHISAVVKGKLHPQMFHVRYFKTYNSHLAQEHSRLYDVFEQMRSQFRTDPKFVSLEGCFEFDKHYDENDNLYPGTTLLDKSCMIGLRRWNVERKSFDVTELRCVPAEFLDVANNKADDENIQKSNGLDDIAMEGYLDILSKKDVVRPNPSMGLNISQEEIQNMDHRAWYNRMNASITEISKLCETKKSSRVGVLEEINNILYRIRKEVHDDLKAVGYLEDTSGSKLVSSSFNMNTSPSSRRYLMAHESRK